MSKLITNSFVVASDYNWLPEDLEKSWVHEYAEKYLIYDKFHRFDESEKVKLQPNVGQNIHDMFDFIVTNYENLPESTLFCRACLTFPKGRMPPLSNGNISEENFLRLANNKGFTELHDYGPEVHNGHSSKLGEGGSFLEINNSWYFNHIRGKYYTNLNTFLQDMYVDPEITSYIRFSPGGNYIIPKENILRNSKKFYERIREILSWDVVVGEAHMIERCLYLIFNSDYQVREEYK